MTQSKLDIAKGALRKIQKILAQSINIVPALRQLSQIDGVSGKALSQLKKGVDLVKLNEKFDKFFAENSEEDFKKWYENKIKLEKDEPEAKPKKLKDISDEDALYLGKLWHEDYEWSIKERSDILILIQCKDYRLFIYLQDGDFVDGEEPYEGETNIEAHGGDHDSASLYDSVIDMIDYLRMKGYNLPNKFATQPTSNPEPADNQDEFDAKTIWEEWLESPIELFYDFMKENNYSITRKSSNSDHEIP